MKSSFLPRLCAAILLIGATALAQQAPEHTEDDYAIRNFRFKSGELLPELKIHYATIGTLRRDAAGHATNAVLLLHGTGGSLSGFFSRQYSILYQPGAALDATKYFIVIPDGIGHGKSSKPSDALHARFPHYEYDDMVEAQYRLLTDGLKIDHLRLVSGISMGGMHTWLWGEEHPDFMDELFPLVSMPVEIAGRNRLWRDFAMFLITSDPDYKDGEYAQEPHGLTETLMLFNIIIDGPVHLQKVAPDRETADRLIHAWVDHSADHRDATDLVYALDASRHYNPAGALGQIKARLIAVNAEDDFINPPDLGLMDKLVAQVPHGKFYLVRVKDGAHGHGSGGDASLWKQYLEELQNGGPKR